MGKVGIKRFQPPSTGELSLAFGSMELRVGQDQTPMVCTAGPGLASDEALKLVMGWLVTVNLEEAQVNGL